MNRWMKGFRDEKEVQCTYTEERFVSERLFLCVTQERRGAEWSGAELEGTFKD